MNMEGMSASTANGEGEAVRSHHYPTLLNLSKVITKASSI
jgi:hypothetical protein